MPAESLSPPITGQTAVGFSLGSAASPACPIIDRASPVHAMCASASAALALPTASPQRATSTNASMPPSLVTCQPQQDSWPTTALFAVDHSTGHGRPQVCGRSQNCFFFTHVTCRWSRSSSSTRFASARVPRFWHTESAHRVSSISGQTAPAAAMSRLFVFGSLVRTARHSPAVDFIAASPHVASSTSCSSTAAVTRVGWLAELSERPAKAVTASALASSLPYRITCQTAALRMADRTFQERLHHCCVTVDFCNTVK